MLLGQETPQMDPDQWKFISRLNESFIGGRDGEQMVSSCVILTLEHKDKSVIVMREKQNILQQTFLNKLRVYSFQ